MADWLILTAALPTSPSGLRVRIWRALKATGCASLRDGVYILPANAPSARALWAIEQAIRDGGADAHMLQVKARDEAQEKAFRALFDRSELYADFTQALKEARRSIRSLGEPQLRRLLRTLDEQLQAIRSSAYFGGKAGAAAAAGLDTLRAEVERKLSPGEPTASAGAVTRLSRDAFQHKTWATRKRPWVDRLACAWLVQRHIDAEPRFLWLDDPNRCPRSAIGFDFDGARFSHVGGLVSVEVMLRAFGLDDDPALVRLGQLVHCIDIGGIAVDEAAGVETIVRGLRAQHADDDALRGAGNALFDTLYVALRGNNT